MRTIFYLYLFFSITSLPVFAQRPLKHVSKDLLQNRAHNGDVVAMRELIFYHTNRGNMEIAAQWAARHFYSAYQYAACMQDTKGDVWKNQKKHELNTLFALIDPDLLKSALLSEKDWVEKTFKNVVVSKQYLASNLSSDGKSIEKKDFAYDLEECASKRASLLKKIAKINFSH